MFAYDRARLPLAQPRERISSWSLQLIFVSHNNRIKEILGLHIIHDHELLIVVEHLCDRDSVIS